MKTCTRVEVADACELPLSNESVDLIVTDPPYGINYKSNAQGVDRKHRNSTNETIIIRDSFFDAIKNDDKCHTEWIKEAFRVLRERCALYVFCHWSQWSDMERGVEVYGFSLKGMIVLNKSNHGMGDLKGGFAPKHELLLFATKGRHILRFPPRLKDVWDVPVKFSGAHRLHPNEKPTSWMTPAILASSDVGQLVLDPFCGSGSTLKAAQNNQRESVGFDIDEQWVKLSKSRLGLD